MGQIARRTSRGSIQIFYVPRPARSFASPVELLCVGRLVSTKGQAVLLEAMQSLLEKGHHLPPDPGWRWSIARLNFNDS